MDPKSTVIAVDLHGVLFKPNYKNMFKQFFKNKKKLKLVFALINPRLWIDVVRLMHKRAIVEEFFIRLGKKYHRLEPFIPLGIKIANQQEPVTDVVKTLNNLKKKGYSIHLFSNIGSIIFEDLNKKFPTLFKMFDSFTMPSHTNGYLRKPSKKAFEEYLNEHNTDGKQVIFIDDKKRNVHAAKKHGIISILFRSPRQLKEKLLSIGVGVS